MSTKSLVSLWIAAERKRLNWKAEELGRRLREAGYEVADTTIRTWEAGRRPSAENIAGLERLFGVQAPAEPETGTDQAAVVAAIDRQTDVLAQLVSAVSRLDGSVSGGLIGLGKALGPILAALEGTLPRSEPGPDAPHAPLDSGPAEEPSRTGNHS